MTVTMGHSPKSESSRRLQVHILHPPSDNALIHLRELIDPSIEVTAGLERLDASTDVLVHGRPSPEQLALCSQLKALIIPYAGVPAETRTLLMASHPELPVYNLHHNAAAASEMALALLFAAAKTLIPVDRRFREHDWRSRYDGAPTTLLDGKTAVILGFGAIGSRLAAVCHALGMNVHAIRRNPQPVSERPIHMHRIDELSDLLPTADIIIIALPLTAETEGLIGREELAQLPPSCVLVNIARGAIVDEEALYLALKEEQIAAAGVDVWYNYPSTPESRANTPPSRFPFHELDNVVMSPHRGGAFGLHELEQRRMTDLAQALNAIAHGESAPHRVDISAGY